MSEDAGGFVGLKDAAGAIAVTAVGKVGCEGAPFGWRSKFHTDEGTSDPLAAVSVIKIDEVGASPDGVGEEVLEGGRAFVEVQLEKERVGDERGIARDGAEADRRGVADLGKGVAGFFKFSDEGGVTDGINGDSEDGDSLIGVRFAILEINDAEPAEAGPEQVEHGSGAFGDLDCEVAELSLADPGVFGNEGELAEIEIGTAPNDNGSGGGKAGPFFEEGGEAHRPGRFEEAAGVFPEAANRVANLLVGDGDKAVNDLAADLERDGTGGADGGSVAKEIDLIQSDGGTGGNGGLHGGLVSALDPNDLDFRIKQAEPVGDSGGHSAAANLEIDPVKGAETGKNDLVGEGGLSSDNVNVVVGVDVGSAGRMGLGEGGLVGSIVSVPGQNHLDAGSTDSTDGLDLNSRSCPRHMDTGVGGKLLSGEGDTLGVVASRSGDDGAGLFGRRKYRHPIVGSPPFVGFDWRKVLALEEDRSEAIFREGDDLERRRFGGVVNPLTSKKGFLLELAEKGVVGHIRVLRAPGERWTV